MTRVMEKTTGSRLRGLKLWNRRALSVLMLTVMILTSAALAEEGVCYAGEDQTAMDLIDSGRNGDRHGRNDSENKENGSGNGQTGETGGTGENGETVEEIDPAETPDIAGDLPDTPGFIQEDLWHNGSWKKGGYYNGDGVRLGSFRAMMSRKLPKMKKITSSKKILVIGASRVLGMRGAVKDSKVFFYPCGGAKINWFFEKVTKDFSVRQPALLVIRAFLKVHPRGKVIIDMGGNDLSNINAYVGLYRSLQKYFPKAKFYFMGILPRAKGDSSNPHRKKFNQRLRAEFSGSVIDLYDRVYSMKGFRTKDGVHYYKKQIRTYYKWMMKKIGRKVKVNQKTGIVKG